MVNNWADLIAKVEQEKGLPPGLLTALIQKESDFDPNAVSPKGYVGLMQMGEDASKDVNLNPADRTNPEKAIPAGAEYLAKQYRMFGNWPQALAAYNWGAGNVKKNPNQDQWPLETRNYVTLMDGLTKTSPQQAPAQESRPAPAQANVAPPAVPAQAKAMPDRPKGIADMTEEEWDQAKKRARQLQAPPGYGDMGHAEAGRAALGGNGAVDMSLYAEKSLDSLIGLLLSGKMGGQMDRKQIFNGNLNNWGF